MDSKEFEALGQPGLGFEPMGPPGGNSGYPPPGGNSGSGYPPPGGNSGYPPPGGNSGSGGGSMGGGSGMGYPPPAHVRNSLILFIYYLAFYT